MNNSVKTHQKLWEDKQNQLVINAICTFTQLNQFLNIALSWKSSNLQLVRSSFPSLAVQCRIFVTWLTVSRVSSGGGEPWQVVLSLSFKVHLQPVRQESTGSLMIFLTPRQADVQRTWIKHTAHLTTERKLYESLIKYEVWFQFARKKGGKKEKLCQISGIGHEICMTLM